MNFLQACRGFHFERNHHGDLCDHWCLKSKLTLFILFRFPCVYDVRKSYTFFFPVNNVDTSCNGTPSRAAAPPKGVTRARRYFTTHPLISVGLFPSILLFGLQSSFNWQQFETPVIFLGVYRRVYPRHTSKKVILVCRFVPFSLLKLGWNTNVVHSKQLARIAKMLFFNFLC